MSCLNIQSPCLIAVTASVPGRASTQIAPTKAGFTTTPPELLDLHASGTNVDKISGRLIRGNVAIVFYWFTSCAIRRYSLPELSEKLTGWHD